MPTSCLRARNSRGSASSTSTSAVARASGGPSALIIRIRIVESRTSNVQRSTSNVQFQKNRGSRGAYFDVGRFLPPHWQTLGRSPVISLTSKSSYRLLDAVVIAFAERHEALRDLFHPLVVLCVLCVRIGHRKFNPVPPFHIELVVVFRSLF